MKARRDIDGGWAYAVGLGVFISFFIIAGFGRCFGLLYAAFIDTFGQSDSVTSLLLGVRSACAIVSGPVSTALSERYTERKVVIAGALLTSLGFSLSFFATSLGFLIFTIGVLHGIGATILLGPSVVAMGHYFVKMRSRAMTVTSCGGCIGMMVVPIFLQKLVEHYSVRGALLIYGAFSLHLILTGAFLRPLKAGDRQESRDPDIEEKQCRRQPLDNCTAQQQGEALVANAGDEINIQESELLSGEGTGSKAAEKSAVMDDTNSNSDVIPLNSFEKHRQEPDNEVEYHLMHTSELAIEKKHFPNLDPQGPQETKKKIRKSGFVNVLWDTIDFSLLKNPLFVLILISGTMSGIPYMTMTVFLVPLVESRGISRDTAAILLSVMGGCDIVGRLVCGALADRKPLQPKHVIIFTSLLAGILCSVLYVVTDFYGFLGVIMAYGLVCSAPSVLVMPATVHYVGLTALPKAVGVLLFFLGIVVAAAPSLLGLLKDHTGRYSPIFPVMGSVHIIAGLVLLLEPLVRPSKSRNHTETKA